MVLDIADSDCVDESGGASGDASSDDEPGAPWRSADSSSELRCARSRADDDANRGNHERSSLFRLRFCARALIASWTLVPSSTSGMSLIAPYTRAKTDPKRKSQIMAHRGPMPTSFAQM